jgi:hypothetical protein
MKRLLLLISLLIGTNVLFAQSGYSFTVDGLNYLFETETEVSVHSCVSNPDTVIIPSSVNYNGVTYSVTRIRTIAFLNKTSLKYVHIPDGVTYIEYQSFQGCTGLTSIVIPNSVTTIEQYAFKDCTGLTSIVLGSGLTYIGPAAFKGCENLATVTSLANPRPDLNNNAFVGTPDNKYLIVPAGADYSYWLDPPGNLDFGFVGQGYTTIVKRTFTVDDLTYEISVDGETNVELHYCNIAATDVEIKATVFWNDTTWTVTHIGDLAFNSCLSLDTVTCFEQTPLPLLANADAFGYCASTKNLTILFGCNYSLWENATTWLRVNYLIRPEETKYLTTNNDFTINDSIGLINKGRLVIEQGGQLINDAPDNNLGIIEVKTKLLPNDKWSFLGAPFAGYKLEVIVPGTRDVSVSTFNYGTGAWSEGWATVLTEVGAGEGFFTWAYAQEEPIIFTNYGDGIYSPDANINYSDYEYDFSSTTNPIYQLNTGDVTVTKTVGVNNGNWMALANPYTFKLDIAKFLTNQQDVQGGVSYRFDGTQWVIRTTGEINVTEGFFVNFRSAEEHTATFKKSQRYIPTQSKSTTAREFVRLAMLEGEIETEVLFAQNDEATEEYDIFDANKLFSPVEITEPYFVVNNIALAKEEVNTLPYYATMNVRSYGNKEVTFKANYIPEGLSVSIIDGEETIDLGEGVEYTTNVIAGENADRFKVLIKKSLSISDAEELEVNIYNDNRHINIETMESDLQVEVYNALGQKVLSTTDRNFTLNQVSAGAYVVKAFNNKASKTQKVVVK